MQNKQKQVKSGGEMYNSFRLKQILHPIFALLRYKSFWFIFSPDFNYFHYTNYLVSLPLNYKFVQWLFKLLIFKVKFCGTSYLLLIVTLIVDGIEGKSICRHCWVFFHELRSVQFLGIFVLGLKRFHSLPRSEKIDRLYVCRAP